VGGAPGFLDFPPVHVGGYGGDRSDTVAAVVRGGLGQPGPWIRRLRRWLPFYPPTYVSGYRLAWSAGWNAAIGLSTRSFGSVGLAVAALQQSLAPFPNRCNCAGWQT